MIIRMVKILTHHIAVLFQCQITTRPNKSAAVKQGWAPAAINLISNFYMFLLVF